MKYYKASDEKHASDRIDFMFQKKEVNRTISTLNVMDAGKEWTLDSILLVLIAMIIINFNVNHSIEMNIKNIGILQANGYTGRQLMMATTLEVLLTGIFGVAFGLICAGFAAQRIGAIVAASIGMYWGIGFSISAAACSSTITILMVLMAALIASGKYRKLHVLDALRSGIKTHNFKRNYIRLDGTALPLNIALGLKNVFSRAGRNLVIMCIIAFLTLCANAALSMYQNFAQNADNLLNVTGFEIADVGITFSIADGYTNEDVSRVKNIVSDIEGVEEIKEYTSYDMKCTSTSGSKTLNCDAYDNTRLHVDNMVSGKNPVNDDEIMISTVMADKWKVSEGDVVYLEMNGVKKDYMVCGIFQGINHLGKKAVMSLSGLHRLDDTIEPSILYVYKNAASDNQKLMDVMKEKLSSEKNITINDYNDYVSASLRSVTAVMKIFAGVIFAAVGVVIALVLMLLVKIQLVRDRRQYGIYKAIGYTTGQLLLQTSMSYCPMVLIGTVLGCVLSCFCINPLFVVCLSMFGIKKCTMNLGISGMLLMLVIIVIWSQIILMLNSLKIRKIVPCQMIQEG